MQVVVMFMWKLPENEAGVAFPGAGKFLKASQFVSLVLDFFFF